MMNELNRSKMSKLGFVYVYPVYCIMLNADITLAILNIV